MSEHNRIEEMRLGSAPWRQWGPYLSERQWGTVREDYSNDGSAWDYFSHDDARSRAYRWGEDGIAGISDDKQQLCFAIALWNGQDPILKERLFGLTGSEGNHGEDVKEYAFYLDNVPTHSYMKYLYKYPQSSFPYKDLVEENKRRTRKDPEYELLDTGVFDENRYFDVFVEYAKASPQDLLIQITVCNRGENQASLHLLPTLWFRNTWQEKGKEQKPLLSLEGDRIRASHQELGDYFLDAQKPKEFLFTENETNQHTIFGKDNTTPYVKDSFHRYLIEKEKGAVNPKQTGTKAAPLYVLDIEGGRSVSIQLRLSRGKETLEQGFDTVFQERKQEADTFYSSIAPKTLSDDLRSVQRQAFAGLLWNKQLYHYNVAKWLKENPDRTSDRNASWWNLDAYDIFSMPDTWEYPWFAAWDLAFHTVAIALIDPDFAKHQLTLLNQEWYMHPNGQIPAYEWSFSDVNPPVQAWAAMRVFQIEKAMHGREDRHFLERIFHKHSLNFTWWVNRKDKDGRNLFEGGFLGLDNIGVLDRDRDIPKDATLNQVDGTAWMGMFAINLLQIALELAKEDPVYEDMATKYFEHFIYIADAMNSIGDRDDGLWDNEAGYYYSSLRAVDGKTTEIKLDNILGIIPLFAVAPNNPNIKDLFPSFRNRFEWFVENRPEMLEDVLEFNENQSRFLLSLVSKQKLSRILKKVLNEHEFFSQFGIRSVSQRLRDEPYTFQLDGKTFTLHYDPAESSTSLFGGNSNWRGPIWFPLNFLFIESLQRFHFYLGDEFKVECPVDSGNHKNLWDVSLEVMRRQINIFLKDKNGRRPLYGGIEKFQTDPHFKDYILFHEYFHGDDGAGLGASNQTGWTGLVAKLIQQYGEYALQHKPPTTIETNRLGSL